MHSREASHRTPRVAVGSVVHPVIPRLPGRSEDGLEVVPRHVEGEPHGDDYVDEI